MVLGIFYMATPSPLQLVVGLLALNDENDEQIYGQFTPVYGKEGAGALRKVTDETLEEIHRIFDITGGTEMFEAIEQHSDRKAREMGFDGANEEYFMEVFTKNSNEHY